MNRFGRGWTAAGSAQYKLEAQASERVAVGLTRLRFELVFRVIAAEPGAVQLGFVGKR